MFCWLTGRLRSYSAQVGSAWHPLSLAAHSDAKVELLIDVHAGVRGRATWSEQLYGHVESLQARAVQLTRSELGDVTDYPPALEVSVRGPFGSAFSRCFETKRGKGQTATPLYDMVVLFGSGIGLPSALSALHEFIERRRAGKKVPRFVHFMWQARALNSCTQQTSHAGAGCNSLVSSVSAVT